MPIPEDAKELIVELLADAIAIKAHKRQLKEIVRQCCKDTPYEGPSIATIERLITEARQVLRDSLGLDRDEARKASVALYETIIRDPSSNAMIRIKAQERLDKLLGLETQGSVADDAEAIARRIRQSIKDQDAMFDVN